jgi:hypothetical protein
LDTNGAYQPKEKLEEARNMPAGEMAIKLSEGEAKQQLSDKTAKLESVVEWQDKATRDGENSKGDQDDPPIDKEELQQNKQHKENQPFE